MKEKLNQIPVEKKGYRNPYAHSITDQSIVNKNLERIVRYAVLDSFKTQWSTINTKGRRIELVMPRHAYFYFMRKMHHSGEYSLSEIGSILNRGHATVINSVKAWRNIVATDEYYNQKNQEIELSIKRQSGNTGLSEKGETIANWNKFKNKYIIVG
jgi:chromosomal replication initiation ATPase DnaA